jgi:hypothetical protein
MMVGPPAERPVIPAVAGLDRLIVDAGDAPYAYKLLSVIAE